MTNPSTRNSKHGIDVLRDPSINKSTGFTEAERQTLGLLGLIPDVTESIETQLSRVLLQLKHKVTDLDRFILPNESARYERDSILPHSDVGPSALP
jgi:malate dehydrogenase (oxaloacetate-decarboxylating)(NADP+)